MLLRGRVQRNHSFAGTAGDARMPILPPLDFCREKGTIRQNVWMCSMGPGQVLCPRIHGWTAAAKGGGQARVRFARCVSQNGT